MRKGSARTRLALLALALAVVSALAGQASAASGRTAPARLPALARVGDDALGRALRNGRIGEGEYALARALALFHLDKVRRLYGPVARPGPRDATLVLRDLVLRLGELTPAGRRLARDLLARPTDRRRDPERDGYAVPSRRVCGSNMCFHWVERTSDAPPLADVDFDRLPDWVEATRSVFGHVWATEVGRFGYRRPRSDRSSGPHRGGNPNGKLDIFLADIGTDGSFGYCTSDDPRRFPRYRYSDRSAYCVVDDDFAPAQFAHTGSSGLAALEVTAAHEFFHAVQLAYDISEDLWLLEGTAVWMEDEVYDEINGNIAFLERSPLSRPHVPLDRGTAGYKYGAWIFFRFLSEYFGSTPARGRAVIRAIWMRAAGTRGAPDDYSLQAVKRVLAARRTAYGQVFADFGLANMVPLEWYEEGAEYPTPPVTEERLSPSVPDTGWRGFGLNHLSNRYFRFVPDPALAAGSRLRINVDLPARRFGPKATVLVGQVSGEPQLVRIPLDAAGDGAVDVPFDPATVTEVRFVLTSASTRFRCWAGTAYSCRGRPLDDPRGYRFRAAIT